MTKPLTLEQLAVARGYLGVTQRDGETHDLESWLVEHVEALLDAAEREARLAVDREADEALKEQLDLVAHLLEVERREHEETKGYRQHAEQLLEEARAHGTARRIREQEES